MADVAICVGVGLMAVDMLTSRRGRLEGPPAHPVAPPTPEIPPTETPPSELDRKDEVAAPAPEPEPALQVPEPESTAPVTEATERS